MSMKSDMVDRVRLAKEIGLHPQVGPWDITEGEHYSVVAYTDWADMFIPTIIRWNHGEHDDLRDPEQTRENKRFALDSD